MVAEKEAKGGSVLAGLVADTMGDKVKAGQRKLTPVEGEVRTAPAYHAPDVPGVFLTHEALAQVERDLRRDSAELLKIADGIAVVLGGTPVIEGTGAGAVLTTKQREFEADLRAKERAAQAAAFEAPEPEPEPEPGTPAGWKCPTHMKSIEKVSSRSGMKFIGCPDCNLFERK